MEDVESHFQVVKYCAVGCLRAIHLEEMAFKGTIHPRMKSQLSEDGKSGKHSTALETFLELHRQLALQCSPTNEEAGDLNRMTSYSLSGIIQVSKIPVIPN